jgi:hypothetical protein
VLRRALENLAEDDNSMRFPMGTCAQARMLSADLNSHSFVRRYYEISRKLLVDAPCETDQRVHLRRTA